MHLFLYYSFINYLVVGGGWRFLPTSDPREYGPKRFVWETKPMSHNFTDRVIELSKRQEFYHPFTSNSSQGSGWTFSSILWYTGVAVFTIGILYLGYSVISDSSLAEWIAPKSNTAAGKAPDTTPPGPPINIVDTSASTLASGVVDGGSEQASGIIGFPVQKGDRNT